MFQKRISKNLSLRIETYKHLQVTAKATRGTLNSCAKVLTLSILNLIDGINQFLTLGIVLFHLVGLGHLQVVDTHHSLDAISQSLGLLLGNRSLRQVVHVSEDSPHDDCYSCEYQHHIS